MAKYPGYLGIYHMTLFIDSKICEELHGKNLIVYSKTGSEFTGKANIVARQLAPKSCIFNSNSYNRYICNS